MTSPANRGSANRHAGHATLDHFQKIVVFHPVNLTIVDHSSGKTASKANLWPHQPRQCSGAVGERFCRILWKSGIGSLEHGKIGDGLCNSEFGLRSRMLRAAFSNIHE